MRPNLHPNDKFLTTSANQSDSLAHGSEQTQTSSLGGNDMRTIWSVVLFTLCSTLSLFAGDDDKHKQGNDQPTSVKVDVRDYCDPISFAVIGCARDTSVGFITLSGFNAELAADKSVGAWRFIASSTRAEEGADLTIFNLGGETHTFTRVKKFGGGFVAGLNAASGNPEPAPECAQPVEGK